jgi:FkbH-like protein
MASRSPREGIGLATVQPGLADVLENNRPALASALVAGIAEWDKYAGQIPTGNDHDAFLKREIYAFIDYLALFFRTSDNTYKDLYIGEKLKQIYHPGETKEQRRARVEELLAFDRRVIVDRLAPRLSADQVHRLVSHLEEIETVILSEASKQVAILVVGDCLYLDVQAFLPAQCLQDGLGVQFHFAVSKNGPALRKELRALSSQAFDLVFYSPFTYCYPPSLGQVAKLSWSAASSGRIHRMTDEVMADTEATLGALASHFDCPVFVHNTALIRRHDDTIAERAKNLLTRRSRRLAREILNTRAKSLIDSVNSLANTHVVLLDEAALLHSHSEDSLGRKFYSSDLQHPAVLGMLLSSVYRDILFAHQALSKRKLVVCDLDNTLWDGVIGEGPVSHYLERQHILLRLKQKGVILAINSKNDPANVHWKGGALQERDFVDSQINWDSKIQNMTRIQQNLNLKFKDFVFIDDRGDQRELIRTAFPDVGVLDATDDRTWRLLDTWQAMLSDQIEGDRTQLYHERHARESFVAETAHEDPQALFSSLQIRVVLRQASRPDLRRVAELINRTNQFNLAGTRTTLAEITRLHTDPAYSIIVVEASDKFGQMGLVCAAIVHKVEAAVTIPTFVLSCRVFGYGIETTVLSAIRRLAYGEGLGGVPIRGMYQETSHNAPCRSMYPDNGFTWDGSAWFLQPAPPPADPTWLTIVDGVSATGQPHDDDSSVALSTAASSQGSEST